MILDASSVHPMNLSLRLGGMGIDAAISISEIGPGLPEGLAAVAIRIASFLATTDSYIPATVARIASRCSTSQVSW